MLNAPNAPLGLSAPSTRAATPQIEAAAAAPAIAPAAAPAKAHGMSLEEFKAAFDADAKRCYDAYQRSMRSQQVIVEMSTTRSGRTFLSLL